MGRLKDHLIAQMESSQEFREKAEIEELRNPEPDLPDRPDFNARLEWQGFQESEVRHLKAA